MFATVRYVLMLSAAAVLPLALRAESFAILDADRLAMADRLFDKGRFAQAKAEYTSLKESPGLAQDELLYRLAECERALGDKAAARAAYAELLSRFAMSKHAPRARLMRALAGTDDEQRAELPLLDSDKTPGEVRACALYHLGVLNDDADALARAVKADPKGRYAVYAKFRHAALVCDDKDPAVRRAAIRELLEIHFGPDAQLAREALYIAGLKSYTDKRYGEASTLLRRYLRKYPEDARQAETRTMAAWSDYLSGRYADAAALCGNGGTDDADFLLAACAYATGDKATARARMAKYLEDHPDGRYRAAAELPLARMDFEEAGKDDDAAKAIEAAKRGAALSKSAADRLRLAWAYEKATREDEALAEYAAVAQAWPGTDEAAEALFRKALIDLRAGRFSSAELALAEALNTGKNPSRRAEALYWRGVAAFKLGHEAEGAISLAEALQAGLGLDQNREARLLLADRDFKEERVAEAKAAYRQLVREGACERMGAAKIRAVGRFLLAMREGEPAYEEAAMCGKALVTAATDAAWRQSGHALEGAAEEAAGRYTQAIAAYRAALAEDVRTEDARDAALALGILEAKAGEGARAEVTLREAVALNADDTLKRGTAYLWLAKNAATQGRDKDAAGYATVVVALFDDKTLVNEAQAILDKTEGAK